MKILYFGVYNPKYARNWVIINGLRKNGVEVAELYEKPAKASLFKLVVRYLLLKKDFDLVIIGFPGQEIMFLAKAIIRKPIIFDAFTSHYGGYILDRKKWSKNSLKAKYFKFLDRWSCKLADIVLLDTKAHIDFFVKEFNLPLEKFRRIWIGANDDVFKPGPHVSGSVFKVIFFGTYVPLQGAEYIVRAAKVLESHVDISFTFIGKGQDRPNSVKLAEELGLKNINFKDMLKPDELDRELSGADVSLGIFGITPKTPLVIPNKIYEALASEKPVITADTPAIRELFSGEDVLLVKPANPQEIAEAILNLKNDSGLGAKLSKNGHDKFIKFASTAILGSEVKKIADALLNEKKD